MARRRVNEGVSSAGFVEPGPLICFLPFEEDFFLEPIVCSLMATLI